MKNLYLLQFFCVLAIALLAPRFSWAQTSDCLRNAQQKFNIGHLNEIPTELEECLAKKNLKTNFSIKEEEIQAFKLLTLVYIYLDDQRNANKSILRLLKSDPEHEPLPEDPAEFVYLYHKYSSKPIIALSVKLGGNAALISDQETFSAGIEASSTTSYTPSFALSPGIGFEYRFFNNFELGVEVRLAAKSFRYDGSVATTGLPGGNYTNLQFIEQHRYLDFPVFLKYSFGDKDYVPYAYAGYALNMLIGAEQTEIVRKVIGGKEGQSSDGSGRDLMASGSEQRETMNFSVLFGGGVKYKVARIHYILLDVRYELGLTNVVNVDNRYLEDPNTPNLFKQRFLYVDNDFKVSNIAVTFGFAYSIYKTKNLTGEKKKGFLFF